MANILITGALGQIGSELTMALRERYGYNQVIATDISIKPGKAAYNSGPFFFLDCTKSDKLDDTIRKNKVKKIFHLAAILSGAAEEKPSFAWEVNMSCLYNVLEAARENNCQVFTPSSIGVFGPGTPKDRTPQDTIQRPNTMYGVTKVAGELLCDYYHKRFDVDTRGVRYPGLISYVTPPGGGTTDYAVQIYYEAIKHKRYTSYIKEGTYMDMMYMPDAIKAAVDLMEADATKLKHRNAFNVTAMSLAPEKIAEAIKKHIPEFTIAYEVDPILQEIADSWPDSIDDSAAREEWGWKPEFDLKLMTEDMLKKLGEKLNSD